MVIVKAPTKHGLDRKYKPWRRGKSEKSNKRSSLKQQLRGMERLLQKLPNEDTTRREELQTKIRTLQQEIQDKQKVLLEKKNADKAHGQRFLDRQRLTRLERTTRKLTSSSRESELFKIALDQVYVAHHPTDVKYMPLFRKGERVVDTSRQLYRRAVTRRRILKELNQTKERASWIAQDQYDRLPKEEWTIQDEERVFGGTITRQGLKEIKLKKQQKATEDSRFTMAPQHQAVLQAAEQLEAELEEEDDQSSSDESSADDDDGPGNDTTPSDQQTPRTMSKTIAKNDEESNDSSQDSDSSDSDSDDVDPLKRLASEKASSKVEAPVKSTDDASESSSSDSSDSSDEADEHHAEHKSANRTNPDGSDSSDDTSDDDEEEKDERQESSKRKLEDPQTTKHGKKNEDHNDDDEDDDFLMDTKDEEDENVFSMTLKQVPALGEVRGDKSQGWATQRQRPGQFKKRRERR